MSVTSNKMKLAWKNRGKGLTLKQFVRDLVATGDELAKNWFANKNGASEKKEKAERLKNKGGQLQLIKAAVKASRKKVKGETKPV